MALSVWRREPSGRLGGVVVPFSAGAPGEALAGIANGFFEAASGGATVTGSASLAGSGPLTSTGRVLVLGAGTLAAASALTASGQRIAVGAGALSGASSLAGSARLAIFAVGTLHGAGSLLGVVVGDAVALPVAAPRTWRPGYATAAARRSKATATLYPGLAVARKARGGR